ncbi:hypothetical protein [Lutibacter sp.]|uniref:hypothetical protein n=1 Tax=Lutibacter sp. TaxID=1925666 RepID=UPI0027352101|nr:hypothetical protein [Lutibacter sp.]MDP3313757.1 hypothetical protein [Lutibacter sp.]
MNHKVSLLVLLFLLILSCDKQSKKDVFKIKHEKDGIFKNSSEPDYYVNHSAIPLDSLRLKSPEIIPILDSIITTIEQHDWNTFIKFCDVKNYKEQISYGVNKEQYVFEILNLRAPDKIEYLKEIQIIMASIIEMKILTFSYDKDFKYSFYQFNGIISTKEFGQFEFWFKLRVNGKSAKIIGGVG